MTALDSRPSAATARDAAVSSNVEATPLRDAQGPQFDRSEVTAEHKASSATRLALEEHHEASTITQRSSHAGASNISSSRGDQPDVSVFNEMRTTGAAPAGVEKKAGDEDKGSPVTVGNAVTTSGWERAANTFHWALISLVAFCDGVSSRMMWRGYSEYAPVLVNGDTLNAVNVHLALKKGDIKTALAHMMNGETMRSIELNEIDQLWKEGKSEEATRRTKKLVSILYPEK